MSAICPKCNGQGGHDPYCDFCGGSGEVESTQLDDSKNIKVNDDGTISPIDPTKPSRYTINSKNTELADFISDPANIAKAVEGSMDKRNAVMNTGKLKNDIISRLSEFNIWCLCDNDECVKSQNFDIAVDELTKYIEQQVLIGRIEEVEKLKAQLKESI